MSVLSLRDDRARRRRSGTAHDSQWRRAMTNIALSPAAPKLSAPHSPDSLSPPVPATLAYVDPLEPARLRELLAFRAPYLEERLVREKKVGSAEDVARLLDEVKKFLVLGKHVRGRNVPMLSRRIDETWHQFVLFSAEYKAFCHRFFGRFVHHVPGPTTKKSVARGETDAVLAGEPFERSVPSTESDEDVDPFARPELTREEFEHEYSALFGPVSDLWRDELSVTVDTRLTRKPFDRPVHLRVQDGRAELFSEALSAPLLRVDAWAKPALAFLLKHDHFYVRELPSPLDDQDKIDICRPLVARGFFRCTF
jgi:hypothetical protein